MHKNSLQPTQPNQVTKFHLPKHIPYLLRSQLPPPDPHPSNPSRVHGIFPHTLRKHRPAPFPLNMHVIEIMRVSLSPSTLLVGTLALPATSRAESTQPCVVYCDVIFLIFSRGRHESCAAGNEWGIGFEGVEVVGVETGLPGEEDGVVCAGEDFVFVFSD